MKPQRITAGELLEKLQSSIPPVLIDARFSDAWEGSNIKIVNAIRVPPNEVEHYLDRIPRNRELVVYCSRPDGCYSKRAAKVLMEHGWQSVHFLKGGFPAWREAGHPVENKLINSHAVISEDEDSGKDEGDVAQVQ